MAIKVFFTALIVFVAALAFAKVTHDPIQALRYSYTKENETKNLIIGLVLFSCAITMFFSAIVSIWSFI